MADEKDDDAKDAKDTKAGSKPPPPAKVKKKKKAGEVQKELRDLSKGNAEDKPPVDLKKLYLRIGAVIVIAWIIAVIVPGWIPKAVAGTLSVVAIAAVVWLQRTYEK